MVEPRCYRIVLRGELSPRFRALFECMSLECAGGNTVLVGDLVDQADLAGVLNQVQALGLELLSVNQDEPASVPPPSGKGAPG
jgi:hypothetical protein